MLGVRKCKHRGINRIRLEFKAYKSLYQRIYSLCINRIRLEFKAAPGHRDTGRPGGY